MQADPGAKHEILPALSVGEDLCRHLMEGGIIDVGAGVSPWPLGEKGWDMRGAPMGFRKLATTPCPTHRPSSGQGARRWLTLVILPVLLRTFPTGLAWFEQDSR